MADELEVEPRFVAVVVLDVVLGTAGVVLDDPSRVPLKRDRAWLDGGAWLESYKDG